MNMHKTLPESMLRPFSRVDFVHTIECTQHAYGRVMQVVRLYATAMQAAIMQAAYYRYCNIIAARVHP